MELREIFDPIDIKLSQVKSELKNFGDTMNTPSTEKIFDHIFSNTGKLLRPALVFLSAGTVNPGSLDDPDYKLVELAFAIELIHSASLIHDDIIDDDELRRGQKTLNKAYGNKIAVLAGDALYAESFSVLARLFPSEFTQIMGHITKEMSLAELQQAADSDADLTSDQYFKLIKNKTAILMAACCRMGTSLIGASQDQISSMEICGMSFGIAYQLMDDQQDNDYIGTSKEGLEEARKYASKAIKVIEQFDDSCYMRSLTELINYVCHV